MPKGKKFNAAERYFLGKEAAYRDEIRALKAKLNGRDESIKALTETRDYLKAQIRCWKRTLNGCWSTRSLTRQI